VYELPPRLSLCECKLLPQLWRKDGLGGLIMPRYIDIDAIPESASVIDKKGRMFVAWSALNEMPVYEVVRAHWTYKPLETDSDLWLYHCSACANLSAQPRTYCAKCGAKMVEVQFVVEEK
jgi:hypothetical protein